jgi:uncharacterized protein YndB with AHSA1/START domain
MSDLGQNYRVAAIRFERTLPGSMERLWEYLTTPSKLSGWFGENSTIEPREGGAVRLMAGHIRGVVTQWKPCRKLAHTWNVFSPGEDESQFPESYLTLELSERGREVFLVLTHLPILECFEKQNAMGWHTFLDIVLATLRGEVVEARASYMTRNAEKYGVDLNNLAR